MTTSLSDLQTTAGLIQAKLTQIENGVLTQAKALTATEVGTLHRILNTAALQAADYLNLDSGTFGGSPGTYDPNTGGTDKGGGGQ